MCDVMLCFCSCNYSRNNIIIIFIYICALHIRFRFSFGLDSMYTNIFSYMCMQNVDLSIIVYIVAGGCAREKVANIISTYVVLATTFQLHLRLVYIMFVNVN